MKKINIILIVILSMFILPFSVQAADISTLEVENKNNKITVSGQTEDGVLAIAVLVYKDGKLEHMQTCSNNTNYSCTLSKTFKNGNYTVKVADYDGGDYISKDITIGEEKENNPKTYDNIITSFIIGGISLISIVGITFYLKKRN